MRTIDTQGLANLHFTTDYTCMIVYVTNNKELEPCISLLALVTSSLTFYSTV